LYRQHLLIAATHDAILNLEEGYRRIPTSIAIQDALAITYCRTNQKECGEDMFKSLLVQKPGFCHSYSLWLQEEGRFTESIALLNDWLLVEPVQGMAYFCLAEAKAFQFEDGASLIERAQGITDRPKLKAIDKMYLGYALGKAYEKEKEFEKAMRNFDEANDFAFHIFNEGRRMDYEVVQTTNSCIMELYSKEFLAEHRVKGLQSDVPLLIIGMIRTGTTLTDQIVSSHGQIASAGEQPFWKLEGARVTHNWFNNGIDDQDIPVLGRDYLSVLDSIGGPAARITDKQPLNYEMLGLIHIVFPKAKFIHLRRNPIDTCLSIYTTHFGGGPNFAYDKDNIMFHYREYIRLMEHWRKVLPEENLLEIDYEDLVADKERVARQIIEFSGLEWDEACLHHDEKQSMVTTPSRWQARQPVYSSSVERWRSYEPWLGSFLDLQDITHPSAVARQTTPK
jgi:tetratricopeptide (TPR) repeat protein